MDENNIYWQDDGTQRSKIYEDIYFSTENGLAESEEVFLKGIDAPDVWNDKDQFTIYELGFGTGLDFLLTVNAWLQNSSEKQCLNYFSTEFHTLSIVEIDKAAHWPELKPLKSDFLKQYLSRNVSLYNGCVTF